MSPSIRVLIAGESWITHCIHQKGFDSFTTTSYAEGVGHLRAALEEAKMTVDYLPNHLASVQFPTTLDALKNYSVVVLSDIGANTLLLSPDTFDRSMVMPNRLALLKEYVTAGGGLVMVGGYLTFQGIDGRARYSGTPVEEVLPVRILPMDDRVEAPEGQRPKVRAEHPVIADMPREWPHLLGYNRVQAKPGSTTLVEIGQDPLLTVWDFQKGRSAAFTSDCGPHWCPPEFVDWVGYKRMWQQLITWVAKG
ncbi:MAG: glutamine amidotransferase [Chloroflexota bacterium]